MAGPTFAECRAAAQSARSAEHGVRATRAARPAGMLGIARDRGPLSVLLYVAAREGRLVWQGVNGFAVLEPPLRDRGPFLAGGMSLNVLRLVDRHWPALVMFVPCGLAFLAAVSVFLVSPALWLVSVLLVVAGLAHVTFVLTCMLLRQTVSLYRLGRPDPPEWVSGSHWHVRLCHQARADRAGELLVQLSARLVDLVDSHVRSAARPRGARVDGIAVTHTLVFLMSAVTTTAMATTIVTTPGTLKPYGDNAEVVVLPLPHSEAPVRPATDRGGFLVLYLVALAAIVFCLAPVIADLERSACLPNDCAGHPATYGTAARWLAGRLIFSAPDDLASASTYTSILGYVVSIAGAMTVPVAFVAGRGAIRSFRNQRAQFDEAVGKILGQATVLVLVVKTLERDAVLAAVTGANDAVPRTQRHGRHVVFGLGSLGGVSILLGHAGDQGTTGPNGMTPTADELIAACRPAAVVLTGICYGLWDVQESIGDVIVAQRVFDLDHRKETESAAGPTTQYRGERVSSSPALLNAFTAGSADWTSPPAIHFGVMASSNTVLDSATRRKDLQRQFPEIAGGDMESAAVMACSAKHKVDWIVVKGISDRGMNMGYEHQVAAARNAAEFLVHTIRKGEFARPPGDSAWIHR
jgi:nucleoside phosphorylase